MTQAYFETSALDAVVKGQIPVSEIRRRLEVCGLAPCVGSLTLNESAQPILSDRSDVALATFQVIRDLQPRFLADPAVLYERETCLLRDGTPVSPYWNAAQEEFARSEVGGLAEGRINHRFLELVRDRRKAKFEEWPAEMKRYLELVKELRRTSPRNVPPFRTFEQLGSFFRPDLARFIAGLGGLDLLPGEAETIAASIDRYPAIRTSVYFWWNAYFICLSDRRVPSADKVDDYRHAIEASYCKVFISNDGQLLRSLPRLHETLTPLSLNVLLSSAAA